MIADLKPYVDYKPGLPWLGPVPRHWAVQKPRQIGSLLKGVGGTKEDALSAGVPCVRYGELYTTHTFFIRKPRAFIHPNRASHYTPLHYGDVLFAASGETLEEIGKSAVNLIDRTAVCGGDIILLRPTVPVHAPFLGYVMDCRPLANQKATMGRGTTVKHIYPDEIKSLLVPFPPVPEQVAIARFLDWANGRLERAIRAKQKVITLLNEQKQAILHRAVTRGLDPSVRMKPSGIPWIGELPAHWAIKAVRRMGRVQGGKALAAHSAGRHQPYLRVANVFDGRIDAAQTNTMPFSRSEFERYRLVPNDLLLNEGQSLELVGRTARYAGDPPECAFQNSLIRVQANGSSLSEFLELLFRHAQHHGIFAAIATQTTSIAHLGVSRLADLILALPPIDEQRELLRHVHVACVEPNRLLASALREIELLREYRTRLVADVVTGKLDVRETASKLPGETLPAPTSPDGDPCDEAEGADEDTIA